MDTKQIIILLLFTVIWVSIQLIIYIMELYQTIRIPSLDPGLWNYCLSFQLK